MLTRDHLGSLCCVSLTEKSLVTGTGLRLGLEGSEAENSGIQPRTGSMHMLDGKGVDGGSSVAGSRGQLSARTEAEQVCPGHSPGENEGLSSQHWVSWETHPLNRTIALSPGPQTSGQHSSSAPV